MLITAMLMLLLFSLLEESCDVSPPAPAAESKEKRRLEESSLSWIGDEEPLGWWLLLSALPECVASARRPATPHTIPVASSGRSRRSSVIGTRMSSFDPSKTLLSSSAVVPKVGSDVKRGRRRFSSRIDAAGSAGVRVNDKKRGRSTSRAVVRAGRRIEDDVTSDRSRWWAAHWTRRRLLSTRGTMLCRRNDAKVRVCSSEREDGGGVTGGECCVGAVRGDVG